MDTACTLASAALKILLDPKQGLQLGNIPEVQAILHQEASCRCFCMSESSAGFEESC